MPVRSLVAAWIASAVLATFPADAAPTARLPSWEAFYRIVHPAMVRQKAIDPARALVHLGLLCEVRSARGVLFHAVEARELVRGGPSPRGLNQLLILDRRLRVTDRIEIAAAHGLYCDGAAIVFDLPVESSRLGREGTLLGVDDSGRISTFGEIDAAQMAGIRPVLSSPPSPPLSRSDP